MTTLWNANPRSPCRGDFFSGTHAMDTLLAHGDFGLGGLDSTGTGLRTTCWRSI